MWFGFRCHFPGDHCGQMQKKWRDRKVTDEKQLKESYWLIHVLQHRNETVALEKVESEKCQCSFLMVQTKLECCQRVKPFLFY